MTNIISTELPSLSVIEVLGVEGEIATADLIPVDLINSTSSCADSELGESRSLSVPERERGEKELEALPGSWRASRWKVNDLPPASATGFTH
jgi:hypothetical protein